MTEPTTDHDALLREQVRLMQKADRRSGCLWNLVMSVLFGVFYWTWLALKRLAKWAWWTLRLVWASIRLATFFVLAALAWCWEVTKLGAAWAWHQAVRLVRWARSRWG